MKVYSDQEIKNYILSHGNCEGFCATYDYKNTSNSLLAKRLLSAFEAYERKFIWCRIPKTGTITLANFLGLDTMLWDHFSATGIKAAIGQEAWDNSFKFTFIRHPLERLTSIFEMYRIHLRDGYDTGAICMYDFWEWIEKGCPHNLYVGHLSEGIFVPHSHNALDQRSWLSQKNGIIDFDFIGRLEKINEDALRLKQEMIRRNIAVDTNSEIPETLNKGESTIWLTNPETGNLETTWTPKAKFHWTELYNDRALGIASELLKDEIAFYEEVDGKIG